MRSSQVKGSSKRGTSDSGSDSSVQDSDEDEDSDDDDSEEDDVGRMIASGDDENEIHDDENEDIDDSGSGEDEDFEEDDDGDDEDGFENAYNDGDDDDDDDVNDQEISGLQWKDGMKSRASSAFMERLTGASKSTDWMKKVYGDNWMSSGGHHDDFTAADEDDSGDDKDDDDDDLFQLNSVVMQSRQAKYDRINAVDSCRAKISQSIIDRWSSALRINDDNSKSDSDDGRSDQNEDEEAIRSAKLLMHNIRNKFVTGDWSEANKVRETLDDDNDESEYGDFEDLETGEKFSSSSRRKKEQDGSDSEESNDDEGGFDYGSDEGGSDSNSEVDSEVENDEIDRKLREENMKKKASQKESFDKEYDETKQMSAKEKSDLDAEEAAALEAIKKKYEEQRERNRREFGEDGEQVRFQYEGFRQGIYVRILIQKVPMEFTESFRSETPIILGGHNFLKIFY